MYRPRIKICGITQVEDALTAARAGVDAIGLNFYQHSPRYVEMQRAAEIVASLPAFVTSVGLFVNHSARQVWQVLDSIPLDCLQFHGDETDEFCCQFGRPYIKAISMKPGLGVEQAMAAYPGASAILLDAWDPKQFGGTGKAFNWQDVPADVANSIILAGGLSVANVGEAIDLLRPYGVDVSGGVELEKGVKSGKKIVEFVAKVNQKMMI